MDSLDVIKRRARAWRDDRWTDKLYLLRLFANGDEEVADYLLSGDSDDRKIPYNVSALAADTMPDYPSVVVPLGMQGVANELLVNARINLQSIVYADPEFQAICDSQVPVDLLKSYFRQVWQEKSFESVCYEVGMDVELQGLGFAECGIGEDLGFEIRRIDPLDVMFDNAYRTPAEWRGMFVRRRLPFEDAMAKYGHIVTEDQMKEYTVERSSTASYGAGNSYFSVGCTDEVVIEWTYYSRDTVGFFLGNVEGGRMFRWSGSYEIEEGEPGFNPMGRIPIAAWVDNWVPGCHKPVGKVENVWRAASMLIATDSYKREVLARGIPINVIAAHAFSAASLSDLSNARGVDDIEAMLIAETSDAANAIHRIGATEIPVSIDRLEARMREMLNSSSGVMDAQRGVIVPGERSATEYRTLSQAQGVQAKHSRRRFAEFVRQLIIQAKEIGALWDSKPRILNIPQGSVDTRYVSLKGILQYPMDILIDDSMMQYKSDEERFAQRVARLQAVDLPAVQAGAADVRAVFEDVYRDIGDKDAADRLLYTQEQMDQKKMQMQQEAMMAQQAQQQPAQGSPPPYMGALAS